MKKWSSRILKALGLAVLAYLAFALIAPSSYSVERSKKIGASPEIIYSQLSNFENWKNWSPKKDKDSSIVFTHNSESIGVGDQMLWDGNPEISGSGNVTLVQLIQNSTVSYDMKYDDRLMNSSGRFEITEGKHTSKVTWHDRGSIPFLFRPIAFLSGIESQVVPDLERGLELLDSVAELRQTEFNQSSVIIEDDFIKGFEELLLQNDSLQTRGLFIDKIEDLSAGGTCKSWPFDLAESAIKK